MSEGKKFFSFFRLGVNPKLRVFLVCLLISGFIWTTMVLSKNYDARVKVDLAWENTGNLIVVAKNGEQELEVELESQGFGIFTDTWFSKERSIILNPSHPALSKSGMRYKLASSKLRLDLNEDFGKSRSIKAILPDSLIFYLCPSITKDLQLRPNVSYANSEKGMMPGTVLCDPSSIAVTGPQCILDTITYLNTDSLFVRDGFREGEVNILIPSTYLSTATDKAFIKAPLFPILSQKRKVPIKVLNVPENYTVKTFPDSVEVEFLISSQRAKLVRSNEFKILASLPLDSITLRQLKRINLELSSAPSDAEQIVLSESRVEFILLKK